MKANNITRLLDQRKITYTAHELPAEKLGALETARLLDMDPALVYKSIVILREGKGKPILAVIPGDREVDLKLVAAALNEKKVRLPSEREAEQLTGLQAGGISPLALINKGFQVIVDSRASELPEFHISGGQRGLNICLAPTDVISLTSGRFATVSK